MPFLNISLFQAARRGPDGEREAGCPPALTTGACVVVLSLVYLGVALALLPGFRWAINADGLSYIAVARRYLAGDWHVAVNGYWGPLLSWALVPFLALRVEALLAGKLLAILIGLITIPGLNALALRFGLAGRLRMVVLVGLLPALWYFTFHKLTPDFLMVCMLVWYFVVILDPGYRHRSRNGMFCGVWGALAYFTKAYAFFFFLAHFTLVTVLLWVDPDHRDQRCAVLRNYVLGMAVFALLTGGWIAALSGKYGGVTVGTAGAYTRALSAPEFRGQPPLRNRGFIAPLDAKAISMWEDPSRLPVLTWSATASADMMKHQTRVLIGNLADSIRIYSMYSPLSLVILVTFLVLCVRSWRRCLRPGGEALPLFTVLLYSAGYVLILVQDRYLFVCLILVALMGAQLAQRLENSGFLSGWKRTAVWLVLALSIASYPAWQTVLRYGSRDGREAKKLSEFLGQQARLQGSIAANRHWAKNLYVAYHLGLPYFGVQYDLPDDEVIPALKRLGVRYYFVWSDPGVNLTRFQSFPEVTGGKVAGLKVYDLGVL